MMLTMTDEAGVHLAHLLEEVRARPEWAVRFVAVRYGLSMRLDNPRPGDSTFASHGRTVLLMDEKVSRSLDDRRLELERSSEGPQLLIR